MPGGAFRRLETFDSSALRGCSTPVVSRKSSLVRLAGFEPTTPWFVAKYSIQLSYSRQRNKTIA
jgi:hypothetical protein